MTKNSFKFIAVLCVGIATVGLASFTAGCSSTPTRESTGEYIDDSTITAKVKADLVHDPVVKALEVNVETFKGVVQLSGFVNTAAEKNQAGRVAAAVRGVTNVTNNIVVK